MTVDYSGIRWWIMIVGAADHRLREIEMCTFMCTCSDLDDANLC